MKDIALPVSIAADVCWHGGRIMVARHSGAQLVVEAWNSDLSSVQPLFETAMPGGNAAPRICSYLGVLWLAYRDAQDRGHLVRLDDGLSFDLGIVYSQRPFTFGNGHVAWLRNPPPDAPHQYIAYVIEIGEQVNQARVITFESPPASGLSHIDPHGVVVPYEAMQSAQPWAFGFTRSGPYLFGEDFGNRGLRGSVEGVEGRFHLWPESEMHDPRAVASDGFCILIAWASRSEPARLGRVSPVDLITQDDVPPTPIPVPEPPPTPEPQPMYPPELDDQLALVTEVRNTLFPDKIGQPLNDPAKAMLLTKHVAWRLRQHGVGLAKAKPGSENNVDGFTSDIVALANGIHWDIQQDGHTGPAFPRWALEENPANYPPIAARWTPAVDPGGVPPRPRPDEPGTTSGLGVDEVNALIADAIAPLKAEIAELRRQIAATPQPAAFPSAIALKSAHGRYVAVEPDGTVIANRNAAGDWETLKLEPR